jgi:hypothetical protein
MMFYLSPYKKELRKKKKVELNDIYLSVVFEVFVVLEFAVWYAECLFIAIIIEVSCHFFQQIKNDEHQCRSSRWK